MTEPPTPEPTRPDDRSLCPGGSQHPLGRGRQAGRPRVAAPLRQVGGQDELVFDGASFALNADKTLAFQMSSFREEISLTEWKRENGTWKCVSAGFTFTRSNRPGKTPQSVPRPPLTG